METKRNLSNISVPADILQRIDNYCNNKGFKGGRKGFVISAIDYFERTDYNLNDEYAALSPLENIVEELKEYKTLNGQIQILAAQTTQSLAMLVKSRELLLPPTEIVKNELIELAELKVKYNAATAELKRVKKEINRIKKMFNIEIITEF